MNVLRRFARKTSGLLGRNSAVINALRPAYNLALHVGSGGRGIVQSINGRETFRVDPWMRAHFYEDKDPEVCAYLRSCVRPGALCLNVGAHVGVYALCLARWSGPTGRVIAFEPNPFVCAVLERHVSLNRLTDQIEVLSTAVGGYSGECSFCADGLELYSRIERPNPGAPESTNTTVSVPITTLDEFCRKRSMRPDCVTLDIEGTEIEALAGARECVRAGRGRLQFIMELHPHLWDVARTSRRRLEEVLAELGVRAIPLSGQADPLGEYGIVRLEYV